MKNIILPWLKRLVALAVILTASSVHAVLVGPYTADATTLHLWHLNETAAPAVDSATSGGVNLVSIANGATLSAANTGYTAFGSALSTIDGGENGTIATAKDAFLAISTPPANATITIADPTTGAFTMEALVWIDFDPTLNYTNTPTGNGHLTACQILSGESNTNANRIFQFKVAPIGTQANFNVVTLVFSNIRQGTNGQTFVANIPTTGPDAIVSNQWYHVAVTYNGTPNVANDLKLYWTLMDPTRTNADLLALAATSPNTTMSGLSPTATVSTPFMVGNEGRSKAGNFVGYVDEVRVSSVERSAVGMMFRPSTVTIGTQPISQFAAVGDTVTLVSSASGDGTLFYQWQQNSTNVTSVVSTNATLVLSSITTNQAGNYQLIVTNNLGSSATSSVAVVTVGSLVSGIYNTGVDNNNALLAGGALDSHWQLETSADTNYPGPSAYVLSAPPGSWLVNGPNSQWITPNNVDTNAVAGSYTYKTTFFLDTEDPTQTQITGNWVSGNQGTNVYLNGTALNITNTTAVGSFTAFTISNGFAAGANTLEFSLVKNAGGSDTGVRVEMRGVAIPLPPTAPSIIAGPTNVTTFEGRSASFTVSASGSGPLTYQWYFGNTLLNSQTSQTLLLTSLATNQSGTYTVIVSNSVNTNSASATLTVQQAPGLEWLGAVTSDWDTVNTNWLDTNAMTNVLYADLDDVTFDNNGSAAPNVNIAQVVQPNSIVVSATSGYTFSSSSSGYIAGSTGLTKSGGGTLIMDTPNTYTGTTLIQSGTVQIGNNDANGTLGTGAVSNNASLTMTRTDTFTLPNSISGSGSLTMAGSGVALLSGNNTYTGPTLVNTGSIRPHSTTALGTGAGATTVADNAQLYLDQNINIPSVPLVLGGTGLTGDGALRKGGGAGSSTWGGPVGLSDNVSIGVDAASTLILTNPASITSTNSNLAVTCTGAGSVMTVDGNINLGSGSLQELGLGTMTLAGTNNSWSGGTTISGGTLQVGDGGADGSLPGNVEVDATLLFNSAANLTYGGVLTGAGTLTQSGTGRVTLTGASSFGGAAHINGSGQLQLANGAVLGSGSIAIGSAQTDTSRLELAGNTTVANSITMFPRAFGTLNNPPHILNVSGTNTVTPANSPIAISTGGNLAALQSDAGYLIFNGGFNSTSGGRDLVLEGASSGEVDGAITQSAGDSVNLYKLGSGAWTLNGANIYSGTTIISNGTLIVNGSVTKSAFTVAGGTLGGDGTITGAVTVNSGAALAPSLASGATNPCVTLTLSSNLTLLPGSTTEMQINKTSGTNDQIAGMNSITNGGTLALTITGTPVLGDSFQLFSAASYSGTFSGVTPATPGPNLLWNVSALGSAGVLSVTNASAPTITSTTLNGTNLVLSGSGGAHNGSYTLLSSTNILTPLNAWITNKTVVFDNNGDFITTNGISLAPGATFYVLRQP